MCVYRLILTILFSRKATSGDSLGLLCDLGKLLYQDTDVNANAATDANQRKLW